MRCCAHIAGRGQCSRQSVEMQRATFPLCTQHIKAVERICHYVVSDAKLRDELPPLEM